MKLTRKKVSAEKPQPSDAEAAPEVASAPEENAVVDSSGDDQNISELVTKVAGIEKDIEQILTFAAVTARRDKFFEQMEQELQQTRQAAEGWRDWSLITGIHDIAMSLRSDESVENFYHESLLDCIYRNTGAEEYPEVNDFVEAHEVTVTEISGDGPLLLVEKVGRPGLRIGHRIIRKAIVSVKKTSDSKDGEQQVKEPGKE